MSASWITENKDISSADNFVFDDKPSASLLNCVSCVLKTCSRASVPCVLTCSDTNVLCVRTCSRANVLCVLTWPRTNVPYMLTCQDGLHAYMLTCQRASLDATIFNFAAIVAEVVHTAGKFKSLITAFPQ